MNKKIKKFWGLVVFLGIFFSNQLVLKNVPKKPDKMIHYELNSLMIERIKAINIFEGDSSSFSFLDSLERKDNFSKKKKEFSYESKDSLVQMLNDYSGKNLFEKKYNFQKIYNRFVELNKNIYEEKSKIQDYKIFSYNGLLHLENNGVYVQNNFLKKIVGGIYKLKKLERFSKYGKNASERAMALTFLHSAEYIPFLYQISKKSGLEISSLLAIISNESSGYPYILGPSGDLNFFQINKKTIPIIYKKLKKEKNPFFKGLVEKVSLRDFEEEIKLSPKKNILVGAYLLKILKKDSKNESQEILFYHLGQSKYKKIPRSIRKRIEDGKIKNYFDIQKKDLNYLGMEYLRSYFNKKQTVYKIDSMLK